MDDKGIIGLYFCRDEAAITETANKYGKRLRNLSYGIVQDTGTAEECENDSYMEAWSSIPPKDPSEYFYPYLARIIRHLSLNRVRSGRVAKRQAEIVALSTEMEQCLPSQDSVDTALSQKELADSISKFLWTLKPEKRKMFVRRYWFLDSVEGIAKRFSVSQSKVKTTLYRCRNQLKKHLEEEGHTL